MEELIENRRSCRRYQKKNVDPALITRMLKSMAAAPTGGNCCSVEYTVIDDKDKVEGIRRIVYKIMEKNAKRHIYTDSFDDFYYARMKESEQSIRKDDKNEHPGLVKSGMFSLLLSLSSRGSIADSSRTLHTQSSHAIS